MEILVTAFAPFGGERVNPTQLAINALPDSIAGAKIYKLVLPVSYRDAVPAVLQAIKCLQPAAVILTGQAGGRCAVTPERVAINHMGADIADNDGSIIHGKPICKAAPAAYFSTLPIEKMVSATKRCKLPAAVSNTAGTFICNQVMYGVLHEISEKGLSIPAGFIHVPYLPEQTEGKENVFALPLDKIVKALTICTETVVRDLTNYVYIVRCADGSLYTGWTNDLEKRMHAHASGQGAKYTKAHTMQELVYFEVYPDRRQAMRREWEIKQLPREKKLALIAKKDAQP